MLPLRIAALLAALAVVPAAAHRFIVSRPPAEPVRCFSVGGTQYRLSNDDAEADVTVRITTTTAAADLRLELVETPDAADFVLTDDANEAGCSGDAIRTIRIDPASAAPDMTVQMSRAPADHELASHKLYVRSAAVSAEDAAALFAVLWRTPRRHAETAAGSDR